MSVLFNGIIVMAFMPLMVIEVAAGGPGIFFGILYFLYGLGRIIPRLAVSTSRLNEEAQRHRPQWLVQPHCARASLRLYRADIFRLPRQHPRRESIWRESQGAICQLANHGLRINTLKRMT